MKAVKIGYQIFAMPDSMSAKDIQALAGFFAVIQRVETRYNFETGDSIYYSGGSEAVQIVDVDLVSASEAKRIADETHERYKAKQQAEAQSA